ncbi:MAG TPA: efflux RND transporter periplasmic adaptor subunit, partial [Candidatus Binatia bacterium]
SRTLLTELRMDNAENLLQPGMYTDVKFHLTRADPPFVLPLTAVIIRSGPPHVATVGPDGKVHFKQVQLGRDFGTTIEIASGIGAEDRIVAAPADNLQDGAAVHPVMATNPNPTPAS